MEANTTHIINGHKVNVAFRPLAGTSQELALACPANHILLTGGRGWGKTVLQLMRFARRVGMGYGSYWRGIIFDREYKNLDDLVSKSKQFFYLIFGDKCRFLSSKSDYKWVWDTGEELLFRHASKQDDYWSYHGHEYPFIGWNELTKYYDRKLYQKMMSVNRSGFDPIEHTPKKIGHNGGPPLEDEDGNILYDTPDGKPLPPIPLEVVSTTNPYGPGHAWVKQDFIDPAPYGRIIRKSYEIFNSRTKREETITKTQCTIFGKYTENIYLSPEYIAGMMEETDENIIKAWISGDWDIVAGGALDDKWKKSVHVIKRFKVPSNWYIDRAFDWGSSHPFGVIWFAEANGEEVEYSDGTTICPPKGTLIAIADWYGAKAIGTNEGLKLSAKDIAEGILEREEQMLKDGWIQTKPMPGPADNQISNVGERDTETIEKKMSDKGVVWERSDKSKGSRINGLELIRERLEASLKQEGPGLLFMDNCRATIATVPIIPRDENNPEDADSNAEDHLYDVVRYRVLKGNDRSAKVIKVNFPR